MGKILDKDKIAQKEYKKSILEIIDICKANNVKLVFLTQPLLFGEGIDPRTGLDLVKYQFHIFSGLQNSQKLELYNQTVRQVCVESQTQRIDLAKLLPKDSKYFFDDMHFSDTGCQKISEVIFENWEK